MARRRIRFLESGIGGIEKGAPRPGRKPTISARKVRQIVRKTTRNATRWNRRTMPAAVAVSASTVGRIWRVHGLDPHLGVVAEPRVGDSLI